MYVTLYNNVNNWLARPKVTSVLSRQGYGELPAASKVRPVLLLTLRISEGWTQA